jgi:hypothetical protein
MNVSMKKIAGLSALLGLGLIAASCGRGDRAPLTPAAGVAPRISAADAAEEIAQARCNREQRCNNIGADAEFQSREHCLNVIRPDTSHMLAQKPCEYGVSRNELSKCMNDIASERCSGVARVFDRLERFISCRADSLCL